MTKDGAIIILDMISNSAKQEGRREVVEWIQKYSHLKDDSKNLYLVMDESWEAKLKEWGLN